MSSMIMRDALTQDAASEEFFAAYTNWYGSSYGCRACPSRLYKIVFAEGREFEIDTDDPANPHVAIKRLFTCARCQRFVTTAASEDEIGVLAGGYLGEPNNFEYQCASTAEYRGLLQTTDAIGTNVGRQDAGFLRLEGGKPPLPASATPRDDLRNESGDAARGPATDPREDPMMYDKNNPTISDGVTTTPSPLAKKAEKVATIFDILARIVLAIGGIGVVVSLGYGLGRAFDSEVNSSAADAYGGLAVGLLAALAIAAYTAILWASTSLSTIVARYIANRS